MFYVGNIMGEWGLEWRGGEVGFKSGRRRRRRSRGSLTPVAAPNASPNVFLAAGRIGVSWEPGGFQQGGGDPLWGDGLAAAAQRGTAESGEAEQETGRFGDWGTGQTEGADLTGAEGAVPESDSADV